MGMAKSQLQSLQVLRGFAALAVVVHHSVRAVTVNRPADLILPTPPILANAHLVELGASGVDVFFVLSGFLMVFIARPYVEMQKPIWDFIAHRIIRIWPLYVLITILECLLELKTAAHSGVLPFDIRPVRLLSIFFVPSFDEKGLLQPIIGPGWTLNYEFLFYACFAFILMIARKNLLSGLTALISVLFLIGMAMPKGSVAHTFLFNGVVFEFLLGAIIAQLFLQDRLPKIPAIWFFSLGAVILAGCSPWSDDSWRFFTRGLPAALVFIGMLRLSDFAGWPKPLLLLGNASYSIYLIHIIIVYPVTLHIMTASFRHRILLGWSESVAAAAAVIGALGAGVACYILIEKPLLTLCRGFYARVLPHVAPPITKKAIGAA
jgi:peptidoglycan/LPS O-acetylase OafA/YrhL